ncbi:tRNA (adenosine(37)-N6)-threonylcarbamoyltransferase complex dimerization subunit type 1 TsaB [Peptacetobacter sp.]|uniref:tRNA (adenosine(37)-N6)-threonylcarbamoyltransferase complex dimerization subunit type 1 TsaB n=1 Tax=Peptacetobacter sp. TaxID=2991975 RepID=UPI00263591BD|nr:tRNA (adenosine(37)-N6)-threonylcarbamoyltransferase complex dimerization subunit type 1 TsaB [Peptacetobacter sp.]
MKILGMDTSSRACSIAVVEDDCLICEFVINNKKTHSQKLMPMIETMLNMSDLSIEDMDAIAVSVGPGSFTGLRISMATAKAISHVNDIPIISVNALESLAANMDLNNKKIYPILDAQRTQVYTAKYEYKDNELLELERMDVKEIDELINIIKNSNEETIVLGEAVSKYYDKLLSVENIIIPAVSHNVTKASSVCAVALAKYKKGEGIHSCYDVNPIYIRKSQAEVQYEEKMKKLEENKKDNK